MLYPTRRATLISGRRCVRSRSLSPAAYFATLSFQIVTILLLAVSPAAASPSHQQLASEYSHSYWLPAILVIVCVALCSTTSVLYVRRMRIRYAQQVDREKGSLVAESTSTLKKTNLELRRSLSLRNKLFQIISHDLRGICQSIIQIVGYLGDDNMPQHRKQEVILQIGEATKNVLLYIERMASWISVHEDKGEIQAKFTFENLKRIIDNQWNLLLPDTRKGKMRLINSLDSNLSVATDLNLLSIIIFNMLKNSIVHSDGSLIKIQSFEKDAALHVIVSDNGNGLRDYLIENFNNDNPENKHYPIYGKSLGMLIIRELSNALNIEVRAGNTVEGGAYYDLKFSAFKNSGF